MGTIAGAFGTAHIVMARGSGGAAGERVFQGLKEIGRRVRALRPDVLLIASSEHFYNYHADNDMAFAVSSAVQHQPFGDMQLPLQGFPGQAGFATGLIHHAAKAGFEIHQLDQTYRPDHGVVIPALVSDPQRVVPVVPLITHVGLENPPSFAQGYRLGQVLRDYIEHGTPADMRVVVMGTGGLSHWLALPEMGRINEAFDREVLQALASGQARTLCDWDAERVVAEGGNGALELVNWMIMAGAADAAAGELVYYEPVAEWITGLGGLELHVG